MDWFVTHVRPIVDSVVYATIGTVFLLMSFWVIEKLLPFSITKEIADDQNVGLGIILGAFILGISLILLDLKKVRVANLLPAVVIAPLIVVLLQLLQIAF